MSVRFIHGDSRTPSVEDGVFLYFQFPHPRRLFLHDTPLPRPGEIRLVLYHQRPGPQHLVRRLGRRNLPLLERKNRVRARMCKKRKTATKRWLHDIFHTMEPSLFITGLP